MCAHTVHAQDHCSEGKRWATSNPATTGCFSTPVPTESSTCPSGGVASTIDFTGLSIEGSSFCTAGLELSGNTGYILTLDPCGGDPNCPCPLFANSGAVTVAPPAGETYGGITFKGPNNAVFDLFSLDVLVGGSSVGCLADNTRTGEITITGERVRASLDDRLLRSAPARRIRK